MREDTFDDLVRRHAGAVTAYARALCRDQWRAEEAVQETLLAALQSRDRFDGGASVRTWLIGILKHKVIDMFRREVREVQLEDPDEVVELDDAHGESPFNAVGHWRDKIADWGNPEEILERSQFMTILQRCLDALPKRHARLFMLREVMEEETENICKEMEITPTNLWTMLYRARFGVRECLDRNWAVSSPGGK
jgi:RNA polymerase sigma-70 factor (ECF subfamily)